jgi:PAS domain S-box-containing protein
MPKYTQEINDRKGMEKSLGESENRFREIVEHAPIAIACYDDKRDSVFANRKFEELTGYSLSEIPTADIFRNLVFPDESYRNWVYNKWTVNNDFRIEVDLRCKNGEIKSVEATKSVFDDQTYIIANDVTDRKKATEEMSISEGKYRRMFYENPYPVWIYDIASLKILEVNHAAIQKYGYDKKEFSDLTLKDIVSKQDLEELLEFMNHKKKRSKNQKKLWNYLKKNGETMVAELAFYPIDYLGKKAMQVQINDVTEKIKLERRLEQQQKLKQQQITEAVLLAQENERSELGKELHDNINQILAASKMFINTALNTEEPRRDLLTRSMNNISLAIEEIRKLSKTLITPQIKEIGLVESIKDLLDIFLTVNKMRVKFDVERLDEGILNKDCKITIYRIVQEQLNNIVKYSKATSLKIQICNEGERIDLNISDNGNGFDPKIRRKGIGITNIISRAELYNGYVNIDSAPGKGCRLKVVLYSKDHKSL